MSAYLKDVGERAVTSFAGAALTVLGAGAVNLLEVDWKAVLGVGAGAALIAVLKGLAAKRVGDPESASTVPSLHTAAPTPGRHTLTDDEAQRDET